ncbi:MAG: dihydrofolate reductase [bacterium]|jgi:dihydrofolate reductase|nr:dihydrofolate reductase [bacterium]
MISLIFAIDPFFLIGKGNDLPWDYPEDLKYFKKITLHKTVLMGLETFQSIIMRTGRPLPKRHNVVASLSPFQYEGVEVINDLFSYLSQQRDEEVFVIGGKTIYQLSLPYADYLYITHIEQVHQGDVYFGPLDLSFFELIHEETSPGLRFCKYKRKSI